MSDTAFYVCSGDAKNKHLTNYVCVSDYTTQPNNDPHVLAYESKRKYTFRDCCKVGATSRRHKHSSKISGF